MGRFSITRKRIAIGSAIAVFAAGGVVAYAYFSSTGSGNGNGAVGSSSAVTINQASITYSNALTDNALLPGTTADVSFTVDNPSSGHENVATISLSGWTAWTDSGKTTEVTDCDSNQSWITMADVTGNDVGPGLAQAITNHGTIVFNNLTDTDQSACHGAFLVFSYSSN